MIYVIEWPRNQTPGNRQTEAFVLTIQLLSTISLASFPIAQTAQRVETTGCLGRRRERAPTDKEGPTDRPTGRQKPAGQEEEEAAAARFLGPLQLAQLPDLPTLRVCTYLPTTYLPYYLPNSFVCVCVCMYLVFRPFLLVLVRRLLQTNREWDAYIYASKSGHVFIIRSPSSHLFLPLLLHRAGGNVSSSMKRRRFRTELDIYFGRMSRIALYTRYFFIFLSHFAPNFSFAKII